MVETENPPAGDRVGGSNTDKTIINVLLGVVNWWCLKFNKVEVVNLVMRYYDHTEVYRSSVQLSELCGLPKPGNHKTTSSRPALEPCANDLVKIMKDLVESKNVPTIVIPASELGKVPLDALSIGDERSVSARLESLESSVQSVISAVNKLTDKNANGHNIYPTQNLGVPKPPTLPPEGETFANVASKMLHPSSVGQNGRGNGSYQRQRSRSPQVKRGHNGEVVGNNQDDSSFKKQGRSKHHDRPATAGASKVVIEEVGELQASLQYFIGNTPGKASEDIIRKVLEKCAEPLLSNGQGPLIIESVHCLTKDPEPRTRCLRVVVPPRFKDIMENSTLYPEGWRFREFVGIFRNPSSQNKKARPNESSIVDQVMAATDKMAAQSSGSSQTNSFINSDQNKTELGNNLPNVQVNGQAVQNSDELLLSLQKQVEELLQQRGVSSPQPAQG